MKRIFILFGALALAIGSQAQMNQHSNYIGFNIGGGMNTLMYSPADGTWNPKLGFLGELKYMHFFGKHFGMGIGVQFDYSRSGATYDWTQNADNAISLTHPANNLVYYPHAGFNDWQETQTMMSVNVPIELYWRAPMGERWFFLFGLGAQLDFPLKSDFKADDGSYSVTGYFPATNVEYHDLPDYGFTTYKADESGDIENIKKMGVSIIADLGFNYALTNHWGFYFGLYGGYGITNLLDGTVSTPLLNAPDVTTATTTAGPLVSDYNGVFNSNQIDELHRLNVGAKIGINFGWDCHSTKGDDNAGALVPYDNNNGNNNGNNTYTNPDDEAAAAAQAAEEAAAREARCNARRMNNPDLAAAMANIDADLAEAEQAANESGSASAKEAVAAAKAAAADAKAAHKNGKYCKAYDLFNEAYGDIADSYAADARECAGKKNSSEASQAADDAALYADASHKDGLDCAMAASRNAKINSEIARDADLANRGVAYDDPNFANNLANEAIAMANQTGSKPAHDRRQGCLRQGLPWHAARELCRRRQVLRRVRRGLRRQEQQRRSQGRRQGSQAVRRRGCRGRPHGQHRCRLPQCRKGTKPADKPADRAQLQKLLDDINATVNFDFAKTDPKFDEKTDRAISALCKAMAADKNLKVLVTGHTDSIGSDEGNMKYGMKRAEALKALMVKRGAPAANITTASKGENEPVVENDTEEHRYMNRRAVITLK